MAIRIDMPKLSDTMTEGTLVRWHKKVGDAVEIGDVIADVETDKATMEMEAFDDGRIIQILIQEGERAPVGSTLAILGDILEKPETTISSPPPPVPDLPADPVVESITHTRESAPTPITYPANESERIKASPLARKVAEELGIDLAGVKGTGPAGRILREDVDIAAQQGKPSSVPPPPHAISALAAAAAKNKAASQVLASVPVAVSTPTPHPASIPATQAIRPIAKDGDDRIELTSMRKIIASRLLTSKLTIPHFYLHVEVDAAPLMTLRAQINQQAELTHGNKYTLNDFILKAVINAAQAVPTVNSAFAEDHIVHFQHIGLAVAIAVEDGLVTPVVKLAETKSILQISREVKDLAARAKDKKIKPDEFDGGTITVSNLGAWGVESFDAIVNPPQAIILSIGAAIEKPVVHKGQIVPGLRMNLGLSCDHRVVDGAIGARFLNEVKRLIEQPALMLI